MRIGVGQQRIGRVFFDEGIDRPGPSSRPAPTSVSVAPSIRARSENGASSSSMRPASIFEKSSTSSMMRSSEPAELRMVPTIRFWRSLSGSRSSSSAVPRTPFIGVRISWLMVARKVDLAWLAASASSRAVWAESRSLRRSRWRLRNSVMSENSVTKPPDLVRAAVSRVHACGPIGNSSAPLPRRCCLTISCARCSTSASGTGKVDQFILCPHRRARGDFDRRTRGDNGRQVPVNRLVGVVALDQALVGPPDRNAAGHAAQGVVEQGLGRLGMGTRFLQPLLLLDDLGDVAMDGQHAAVAQSPVGHLHGAPRYGAPPLGRLFGIVEVADPTGDPALEPAGQVLDAAVVAAPRAIAHDVGEGRQDLQSARPTSRGCAPSPDSGRPSAHRLRRAPRRRSGCRTPTAAPSANRWLPSRGASAR